MVKVLLCALALTAITVVMHAAGTLLSMRRVTRLWSARKAQPGRLGAELLIVRLVSTLLVLHLAEALVWAVFLVLIGVLPDIEAAAYFSLTSYTTVGYGDVLLPEPWRLLGPLEAAVGVLMLGWSTGVLVAVLGKIYSQAWASGAGLLAAAAILGAAPFDAAHAQVPPSAGDKARYTGLHAAAARGDAQEIKRLVAQGAKPDARDGYERTPLHVAAYGRHHDAMRALAAAGAAPNALERDRYDIVTIAAVADDVPTLKLALSLGCSAKNVTSRYDGTALIAAAHLGHDEVVRTLIAAGAPLDHVNNLGWTALIESIVLGNGGPRHTATLKALVDAGASLKLADRQGRTPLELARGRGYREMTALLEKQGRN